MSIVSMVSQKNKVAECGWQPGTQGHRKLPTGKRKCCNRRTKENVLSRTFSDFQQKRMFAKTATFEDTRQRPFLQLFKPLSCQPSSVNPGPKGSDNIGFTRCLPTSRDTVVLPKYNCSAETCRHVSSFNLFPSSQPPSFPIQEMST